MSVTSALGVDQNFPLQPLRAPQQPLVRPTAPEGDRGVEAATAPPKQASSGRGSRLNLLV